MALANKERQHIPPNTSTMAIIHASAFYEHSNVNDHEQRSQKHAYNIQEQPHHDQTPSKNFTMSNSSSVSSPSSTSSNGLVYQTTPPCNNLSEESHNNSVITFTTQSRGFGGSFLNFEQSNGKRNVARNLFPAAGVMGEEEGTFQMWEESIMQPAIHSGFNHSTTTRLQETSSSSHAMQSSWLNEIQMGENGDGLGQEMGAVKEGNYNCNTAKRPSSMGESSQAAKKQCVGASKKGKAKTVSPSPSPSKDPQSVAAKNRRERISERLKILQDLVPNGSKVDLVTMLEKAISYVKFLQLQVKVLATDEFWPAPNGKAPDLSQVKEAIDAILASQRDRNSDTSTK